MTDLGEKAKQSQWTGQDVNGYQVLQPADSLAGVEIWDADEHLMTLRKDATEAEVRAAIYGYRRGHDDGERVGRWRLQHEFRILIDAKEK